MYATVREVGEPLDGLVCEELAAIARSQCILPVAGVVETSDEWGSAYNPPRRLAGPTPADWFPAGRSPFRRAGLPGVGSIKTSPSTGQGGVRFELMTCLYVRFPELARSSADAMPRYCWGASGRAESCQSD